MKRTTAFLTATLLATGTVAAPAFAADTNSSSSAAASSATQHPNFSDSQLENFASASKEIAGISQKYTQQLQGADDQDAQQQVRQKANKEMVQAVKDNDLDVKQFNQIGQAVQNDPQLMQKVQSMAKQQ
ncbi:DUF4168 domain-containing protein [Larsenimonas suaedae]|uniref:DUF4168 domain-containing protein n=1 Tax=Larsenimonas suaedae TaxID=1851019 RepID=A0ABU1GVI6_9GAMM|nr:DUF4168 domain-containing protein [Larsenimonas suaedae]MCM2971811.1 DUF4168 domain-containing protein [Larsenimonas suaedae]MDR5895363.1 DUF4168 domain-containing protein [Larsenimonas suaedae]